MPSEAPIAKKAKGMPAAITYKRLDLIVGYIAAGLSLESSAKGAGIHPNTLHRWRRRGQLELVRWEDENQDDPTEQIDTTTENWPTPANWREISPGFDPVEWPFVVFALAVEKALTAFESRMLTVITAAATTSWQAAAWRLERRFPDRYSRPEARLKIDVKAGKAGGGAEVDARVVSAEDIEAAFAEIAPTLPEIAAEVIDEDETDA
jgi:transposase